MCRQHVDWLTCVHTDSLIHLGTCTPAPPSFSAGPSPGVGPMDGLGALVTGFTRATASLGTCPHPRERAQGHRRAPQRERQQGHTF